MYPGNLVSELCKKEKQEEEAPLTKQDLLGWKSDAGGFKTGIVPGDTCSYSRYYDVSYNATTKRDAGTG